MHPSLPKKKEELTEYVEMWLGRVRRLEAHGEKYKLATVFKINALRMLMTGEAKEYSDLWEADRDTMDAAKSYEELLAKVKDYSWRRKFDSSFEERCSTGVTPWMLEQ